jgi:tetratricopeptide (TPR) repeat protein
LIRARRDYYAALLQEIVPQLKSAGQMEALSTIAEEFHDIEAVWATALADQDWTTCGACLDSLYLYHEIKGPFQRGRDFFEELIRRLESAASRDASEQVILGKALAYSGRLATQLGLHQQGAEQLQRSLAILDGTEAGADRAFALKNLGYNAYLVGDYERAARLVGESLTMRRALRALGHRVR